MEKEVAKKKPVIPSCDNCIKESYCPMRSGEMSCTGFQPKRKMTNLDRIRTADIDCLISWFCRGRLCSTCPYNGIECGIRDWLNREVDEHEP